LASEYHKADKPVGDIRPDNIFFNKNGEIKVVTQDSWPREQTNYKKSLNLDEKTYLSP
jgi:DNA-binding helix-hairpin-helix protein with protein kinase domain